MRCSQELDFLGHLGQVGRQWQPARRRLMEEPPRRAVGRVWTEPRPGAGGGLRRGGDRREPVPRLLAGLEPAHPVQADQFGKDDPADRGRGHRVPAQTRRGRVGQQRRPCRNACRQVVLHRLPAASPSAARAVAR